MIRFSFLPTPCPEDVLSQQMRWVGLFAVLTLAAFVLPLHGLHVPDRHYLPLHILVEFLSIAAAFLVFATVWHTPSKAASGAMVVVAVALFSTGWLDFMHMLSFRGMPDLVTPASPEKAIAFWLAARFMFAASLLAVSLLPPVTPPTLPQRNGILALYAAANAVVIAVVLFYPDMLPRTFVEGSGLTPIKIVAEWVITGLMAVTALRYLWLSRRSDHESHPLMFGAMAIAAMGELFFSQYQSVNDAHNVLGHLYKVVSYSLIYEAMFKVSIRKPYQQLASQTQQLIQVNETLRTQALALDSTANPVLVLDLQGAVRWSNRAATGMVTSVYAANGQPLSLFEPPLTPDPAMARDIQQTVRSGRVWRGLVHVKDDQDNDIIMDRTVTPLRNGDGLIEGYVSVAENVTASVQARLRHKRVLDTAIDGFWITDIHGRLLEVNDAYARMSGYTVDELLQMGIDDLVSDKSPMQVQACIDRVVAQKRDQYESRHRHKNGHEFVVDVSTTYDAEAQQLFVFLRDRTERVQSAAIKQDLERQLQQSQKMEALGQLTGGIAHDFNNILAAIMGYSNLALDRLVPDKQSKLANYLREVITASERARDLIAKMLTFTRTQPSANAGVISPASVIAEVMSMMRPSIPSSIQLKSRIDDDLQICMDAGELNQVLVNLVINARDATGGHGTIDIRLHRMEAQGEICAASHQRLHGPFLALDVSDNGSGIAPEHMSRLFDPFFTTKDVGKGSGLGLSMVQGILRRSGAHVVVDSHPGWGSRFRLLFPMVQPKEAATAAADQRLLPPTGAGQCIWVVDDESAVARFFDALLTDWGYRVRVFTLPADVLAAFEADNTQVDLLITDMTMPGMSGVELVRRLHSARPGLPAILCTGYSDGMDRAEVLKQGVHQYFTKPVPANDLLMAVAQALAKG